MKKFYVPIIRRTKESAFARVDLLVGVASLLLLAGIAVPVWAATKDDGKMMVCQNNLKSIGEAFSTWSDAHGQRLPSRVAEKDGGAFGLPSAGAAWVHFYFLTNELKSPKVLACPADQVREASHWGRQEQGGYLNARYRANAISYLVGLDTRPEAPKSILSGDRNIEFSARNQVCDYANVNQAATLDPTDDGLQWENSIHENQGNILFRDGSVKTESSGALRAAAAKTEAAHAVNHVLVPR